MQDNLNSCVNPIVKIVLTYRHARRIHHECVEYESCDALLVLLKEKVKQYLEWNKNYEKEYKKHTALVGKAREEFKKASEVESPELKELEEKLYKLNISFPDFPDDCFQIGQVTLEYAFFTNMKKFVAPLIHSLDEWFDYMVQRNIEQAEEFS